MAPRDRHTPDMFKDYTPPASVSVVARFDEQDIRASNLTARMAKAVSKALKDDGRPRADIADAMAAIIGSPVPVNMLEAYASEAREGHKITAERFVALLMATQDARLLNALLADTKFIAVPARFEALIRREMAIEMRERLDREISAADGQWKASR